MQNWATKLYYLHEKAQNHLTCEQNSKNLTKLSYEACCYTTSLKPVATQHLLKPIATQHFLKACCYTVPLKARCYTAPLKPVATWHDAS